MPCAGRLLQQHLEKVSGLSTGFRQPGALIYTTTEDGLRQLEQLAQRQAVLGIEIQDDHLPIDAPDVDWMIW